MVFFDRLKHDVKPQQEPLNSLKIGLGLCGNDGLALAGTLEQRAQPRVFCLLFCGKKVNANARHEGRKDCERGCG